MFKACLTSLALLFGLAASAVAGDELPKPLLLPHAAAADAILGTAAPGPTAGPVNDDITGAIALGTVLPINRTFNFTGATANPMDMTTGSGAYQVVTLWFSFTPATSGIYTFTFKPVAGATPMQLSAMLTTGFIQIGRELTGPATPTLPLKSAVELGKGRTYLISVGVIGPGVDATVLARNVTLTIAATPTAPVIDSNASYEFRGRTWRRNISGGYYYSFDSSPSWYYRAGGSGPFHFAPQFTYNGPRTNYFTVNGLTPRDVDVGNFAQVQPSVSGIPAQLNTNAVLTSQVIPKDTTTGMTLNPSPIWLYADTGTEDTTILPRIRDRATPVAPGAVAVIDVLVKNQGAVTATACRALSPRAISYRWYTINGATAVAADNTPLSIAAGAARLLRVRVPTTAGKPQLLHPGLAVDCLNTEVTDPFGAESLVMANALNVTGVDLSIVAPSDKVDLYTTQTTTLVVQVANGSSPQLVQLNSGLFTSGLSVTACRLNAANLCTTRYNRDPNFAMAAGEVARFRFIMQAPSFFFPHPADYEHLMSMTVQSLVGTFRGIDVYFLRDQTNVTFSVDCPVPVNGGCPL